MISRINRLHFAFAVMVCATLSSNSSVSAEPLAVETVKLTKTDKLYEIDVEYPRTGIAAADKVLADYAKKAAKDLIDAAVDDAAERRKDSVELPYQLTYSLDMRFEVNRNDDRMLVVTTHANRFTGGAHSNNQAESFTFLRPDGHRVFLAEIFAGSKALRKISALATKDLIDRIGGPDGMTDEDWIRQGAGAFWENFSTFVLTPNELVLHFQEYQVAAYAAGAQEGRIPLSALKGFMRPDWRAPAPSFNCRKARSRVEKAICSDVALARLDRKLSEAYRDALAREFDDQGNDIKPEARDAIVQSQRKWLKERDRNCASGDKTCLSAAYRERMNTL